MKLAAILGEDDEHRWTILLVAAGIVAGAAVATLPSTLTPAALVLAGAFAIAARWGVHRPREAAGLVALGAAVLLAPWNGVRLTEGATVADPLFLLAAVLIVPAAVFSGRPIPMHLLAAAMLIAVSGAFTVAASGAVDLHLLPTIQLIITMVAVPLVVAHSGRPATIAVVFLAATTVGAGVAVFDAVTDAGFGSSVTGYVSLGRQPGLTTHSNHLALAAAMGLPFALQGFLAPGRGRIPATLSLGVLAAAILVSGSRAGVVAGAVGAIVFVVIARRHVRVRAIVAGGLLAAVAIVAATYVGESATVAIDRLTGRLPAEASDAERAEIQAIAVADFLASPIVGTGYGNVRTAHNIYLQMLHAGGLIGLAAFTVFGVGTLRATLTESPLAAAAAAGTVAWLVAGLAHTAVYDRYLYVPAGILLGVWVRQRVIDGRARLERPATVAVPDPRPS